MKRTTEDLVFEMYGDVSYEYYPVGQYIVAAPGVCGGRPTFKYTRLEVAVVLDLLAAGWTTKHILHEYAQSKLTPEAIAEAMIRLAKEAFVISSSVVEPSP
jgi:uncharacterized protein (DUF433 family)